MNFSKIDESLKRVAPCGLGSMIIIMWEVRETIDGLSVDKNTMIIILFESDFGIEAFCVD